MNEIIIKLSTDRIKRIKNVIVIAIRKDTDKEFKKNIERKVSYLIDGLYQIKDNKINLLLSSEDVLALINEKNQSEWLMY
jgi:hypothetical protein